MSIITKSDFIAEFATANNLTKNQATDLVNNLLDQVAEGLKKNDKIQFTGFGTFIAENKPESKGRNPQTGAEITIAARRSVRFKVGEMLKKKVN